MFAADVFIFIHIVLFFKFSNEKISSVPLKHQTTITHNILTELYTDSIRFSEYTIIRNNA